MNNNESQENVQPPVKEANDIKRFYLTEDMFWQATKSGIHYSTIPAEALSYLKEEREKGGDFDLETEQPEAKKLSGRTEMTETSGEFVSVSELTIEQLADLVAARVCAYLEKRMHCSERLNS